MTANGERAKPPEIRTVFLLGRCANGAQRDQGTRVHAIEGRNWKAMCGTTYGKRSAGWMDTDGIYVKHEITCPRCLKRIAKPRKEAAQ